MVLDIISGQQINSDTIQLDLIGEYSSEYLNTLGIRVQHIISKKYYSDSFSISHGDDNKTLFIKLKKYPTVDVVDGTYEIYVHSNSDGGSWDRTSVRFNQFISSIQLIQNSTKECSIVFDKDINTSFFGSLKFEIFKSEGGKETNVTSLFKINEPDKSENYFKEIKMEFIDDKIENKGEYFVKCTITYDEKTTKVLTSNHVNFVTAMSIKSIEQFDYFNLKVKLNTKFNISILKNLGIHITDKDNKIIHDILPIKPDKEDGKTESTESTGTEETKPSEGEEEKTEEEVKYNYFLTVEESNVFDSEYTDEFIIKIKDYAKILQPATYNIRIYNDDFDLSSIFKFSSFMTIKSFDTDEYGKIGITLGKSYPKDFLNVVKVDILDKNTLESKINYYNQDEPIPNEKNEYNTLSISLSDKEYNIPVGLYIIKIFDAESNELCYAIYDSHYNLEITEINQLDFFSLRLSFKDVIDVDFISNISFKVTYEDESEDKKEIDISSLFKIIMPTGNDSTTLDIELKDKSYCMPEKTLTISFLSAFNTLITSITFTIHNYITGELTQSLYRVFQLTTEENYPSNFLKNITMKLYQINLDEDGNETNKECTELMNDILGANPHLQSSDSTNILNFMLSDINSYFQEGNYLIELYSNSYLIYKDTVSASTYTNLTSIGHGSLFKIDFSLSKELPLYFLRNLKVKILSGEDKTDITKYFNTINDYITSLCSDDSSLTEDSEISLLELSVDESIGIPSDKLILDLYDAKDNLLSSIETVITNDIQMQSVTMINMCKFAMTFSLSLSEDYKKLLNLKIYKIIKENTESGETIETKTDVTHLFDYPNFYFQNKEFDILYVNTNTPYTKLDNAEYEFELTHSISKLVLSSRVNVSIGEISITSVSQVNTFDLKVEFDTDIPKGLLNKYEMRLYKGTPSYVTDENGKIIKIDFPLEDITYLVRDFKIINDITSSYETIKSLTIYPVIKYSELPNDTLTLVFRYNGDTIINSFSYISPLNSSMFSLSLNTIGNKIQLLINKDIPLSYLSFLTLDVENQDTKNKITFFETINSKIDSIQILENENYYLMELSTINSSYFLPNGNYIISLIHSLSNNTLTTTANIGDKINSVSQDIFDLVIELSGLIPVTILKGLRYEIYDVEETVTTLNKNLYLSIEESNHLSALPSGTALDKFRIKTKSRLHELPEGNKLIKIFNEDVGYSKELTISTENLFGIGSVTESNMGIEIFLTNPLPVDYASNLVFHLVKYDNVDGKDVYGNDLSANYYPLYQTNENNLVTSIKMNYKDNSIYNPIGKYEVQLINGTTNLKRALVIEFSSFLDNVYQSNLFDLTIEFNKSLPAEFVKSMNFKIYDDEFSTESSSTPSLVTSLFKSIKESNELTHDVSSIVLKLKDIKSDLTYGNKTIEIYSTKNSFSQRFVFSISNVLAIKQVTVGEYQEINIEFENKLPVYYISALTFDVRRESDAKSYFQYYRTIIDYNSLGSYKDTDCLSTIKLQTKPKYMELPATNYLVAIRNARRTTNPETTVSIGIEKIYKITSAFIDGNNIIHTEFEPAMSEYYLSTHLSASLVDKSYSTNKMDYATYYKSIKESNNFGESDTLELKNFKLVPKDYVSLPDNQYIISLKNIKTFSIIPEFEFKFTNILNVKSIKAISSSEIEIEFGIAYSVFYLSDLTVTINQSIKKTSTDPITGEVTESTEVVDYTNYFNNVTVSNNFDAITNKIGTFLDKIKITMGSLSSSDIYEGNYTFIITNKVSSLTYTSDIELPHMCSDHGTITGVSIITEQTGITGYVTPDTTGDTSTNPNAGLPSVPCLKINFSKSHSLNEILKSTVTFKDEKGEILDDFKIIDENTYMIKTDNIVNELYLEMKPARLLEIGKYIVEWNWNSSFNTTNLTCELTTTSKIFSNFGKVKKIKTEDIYLNIYLEYEVPGEFLAQFKLYYYSNDDKKDYSSYLTLLSYNPEDKCVVYFVNDNSPLNPGDYTVSYKYENSDIITAHTGIVPGLINDLLFREYTEGESKTLYIIKRKTSTTTSYSLYQSYKKALERYEKIKNKIIDNEEQYEKCKKCQKLKVVYSKKLDITLKQLRFGEKDRYKHMLKLVAKYLTDVFGCTMVDLQEPAWGEKDIDCYNRMDNENDLKEKMLIVSAPADYSGAGIDGDAHMVHYIWEGKDRYAVFANYDEADDYKKWLTKKNKENNKKAKTLCNKCIKKELAKNNKDKKVTLANYRMPLDSIDSEETKEYFEERLNKVVGANMLNCDTVYIELEKADSKSCKAVCTNRCKVDEEFEAECYFCKAK